MPSTLSVTHPHLRAADAEPIAATSGKILSKRKGTNLHHNNTIMPT